MTIRGANLCTVQSELCDVQTITVANVTAEIDSISADVIVIKTMPAAVCMLQLVSL